MADLSDDELRAHILERLDQRERCYIAERKRFGIPLVGLQAVVARSFLALPAHTEELFDRTPNISADNDADRNAAIRRRSAFLRPQTSRARRNPTHETRPLRPPRSSPPSPASAPRPYVLRAGSHP